MKKKDVDMALSYLKSLLSGFKYSEINNQKHLGPSTYTIATLAQTPKQFKVFVVNRLVALALRKSFIEKEVEIFVQEQKENPGMFEVSISQLAIVAKKNPIKDVVVTETHVTEKTKEQQIIEDLFSSKKVVFESMKILEDKTELFVTFENPNDCAHACSILLENKVEHMEMETSTEMYISLSLPDLLFKDIFKGETPDEKKKRHTQEKSDRLRFFLSRNLSLCVKSPVGKSAIKSEKCVTLSPLNPNGTRRIDFYSQVQSQDAMTRLIEIGFSCRPIMPVKDGSIMVDLINSQLKQTKDSTMEHLMHPIQEETPAVSSSKTITIPDISKVLLDNGIKFKSRSEIAATKKSGLTGKFIALGFASIEEAKKAASIIKGLIPDSVHNKKAVWVPVTMISKAARTARSSDTEKSVEKSAIETVFEMSPEVEVLLKKALSLVRADAALELKKKRNDISEGVLNRIKEENYLISKTGKKYLSFPMSVMEKLITFQNGEVRISKELFSLV